MGIPIKPSRNLTTNGGIAIKKAGHAQGRMDFLSALACQNFSYVFHIQQAMIL
jgi:hypothetical protein